MMDPPPRIRKLDVQARPFRLVLSSSHVPADRPNNNHNHLWTKLPQCSIQTKLPGKTDPLAGSSIQAVHRLSAQINQITTQGSKRIEEVLLLQIWKCGKEGVSDRPIESRIGLIEEPPRSRWRFSNEQDSHTSRAISLPQTFPQDGSFWIAPPELLDQPSRPNALSLH